MVNGLYGLAGQRAKDARALKYGLPPGTPAGKDYVESVWLPAQNAAQSQAANSAANAPIAASDTGGSFLDSLPNKILGQPTWMLLVGGAIFVMYFLKGSSKKR